MNRAAARFNSVNAWLNECTEYRLYIGDTYTGLSRMMTGKDAATKNREYEKKYIAALDANKACRLSHWRRVLPDGKVCK